MKFMFVCDWGTCSWFLLPTVHVGVYRDRRCLRYGWIFLLWGRGQLGMNWGDKSPQPCAAASAP